MKIKISSNLLKHFPNIQYTVILIKNADNLRKVSSLSQLLRGVGVVAKNELKKADKKDLFTSITEQTTEDGSALLESYLLATKMKKVQNGKDFEGKNNLVNLINFLSLKYYLPMHAFDLDQAEKDYVIDLYQAKKGKKSPELELLPQTTQIALWFANLGNWAEEDIDRFISEINVNVSKYMHTQISEVYHLDANHPEIDLGYESDLEKEYKINHQNEILAEANIENEVVEESHSVKVEDSPVSHSLSAKELVQALLKSLTMEIFPELSQLETPINLNELVEMEMPKDSSHGDLSTNLAMKLTKVLKQSPQSLAQRIVSTVQANLSAHSDLLDSVETVGPGFVNFRLSPIYFQKKIAQILEEKESYGRQNIGQGEKIMIEFGSLNIAKPFLVHHLLTTVLGQTLVNIHRALNYQVIAADHPGDWGTQFGKVIYAYKNWGDREVIEKDPINELLKLYVKFHEEVEIKPEIEDAARAEFRKMEEKDQENIDLWKWIVEISLRDLEMIFQTLGVKYDRRYGEAKYNEACKSLLEKGKQLGVFVEGEKGAFIVNLDEEKLPPALVQKADGTSLYITRDLASIEDRLKIEDHLKKIVYVVDVAQSLHFKQLFAIAQRLHAANPEYPVTEFKHVSFGQMKFADFAMSTRKGNVIHGKDVINEAITRAEKIVQEKFATSEDKFTPTETKQLIHGLAVSAIKYAMLCQAPESDFVFDWDKVLSFEGNSAPYLQYSLARANSILKKSQEESSIKPAKTEKIIEDQISLFSIEEEKKSSDKLAEISAAESTQTPYGLPAEQDLLRLLAQFPEKIAAAAENYKPNTLTNYLHDLAQGFNSFYSVVPVNRTQREDLRQARLNLVKATVQVLKNGLQIIGITTFERM